MGEEIINTPKHKAESFNSHFASVEEKLASDITPSAVERDLGDTLFKYSIYIFEAI